MVTGLVSLEVIKELTLDITNITGNDQVTKRGINELAHWRPPRTVERLVLVSNENPNGTTKSENNELELVELLRRLARNWKAYRPPEVPTTTTNCESKAHIPPTTFGRADVQEPSLTETRRAGSDGSKPQAKLAKKASKVTISEKVEYVDESIRLSSYSDRAISVESRKRFRCNLKLCTLM